MKAVKEILNKYKAEKVEHFKCKSCKGSWSSRYNYVKCPICKSEKIERKV